MSAYRSARRNADGLFNQVLVIEEAIAEIALDHRLVTAVLPDSMSGPGCCATSTRVIRRRC